ncbi:hypothetical protein L2E82_15350 [Cichorium intybus]|uniref:Uncharacterized protein n=1 Tax=Cichorium intybus TaxID=13427 RepID=A0ACB9F344_CICIN|nr:hypothetical protein L2E82_15350 [Cichorium intybus]
MCTWVSKSKDSISMMGSWSEKLYWAVVFGGEEEDDQMKLFSLSFARVEILSEFLTGGVYWNLKKKKMLWGDGGNVNKYSGIMNNVNQVLGGDGAQVGFDGKKDVDRVHGDERISETSCVSSDSLSRPLGFEKRVDDPVIPVPTRLRQ